MSPMTFDASSWSSFSLVPEPALNSEKNRNIIPMKSTTAIITSIDHAWDFMSAFGYFFILSAGHAADMYLIVPYPSAYMVHLHYVALLILEIEAEIIFYAKAFLHIIIFHAVKHSYFLVRNPIGVKNPYSVVACQLLHCHFRLILLGDYYSPGYYEDTECKKQQHCPVEIKPFHV